MIDNLSIMSSKQQLSEHQNYMSHFHTAILTKLTRCNTIGSNFFNDYLTEEMLNEYFYEKQLNIFLTVHTTTTNLNCQTPGHVEFHFLGGFTEKHYASLKTFVDRFKIFCTLRAQSVENINITIMDNYDNLSFVELKYIAQHFGAFIDQLSTFCFNNKSLTFNFEKHKNKNHLIYFIIQNLHSLHITSIQFLNYDYFDHEFSFLTSEELGFFSSLPNLQYVGYLSTFAVIESGLKSNRTLLQYYEKLFLNKDCFFYVQHDSFISLIGLLKFFEIVQNAHLEKVTFISIYRKLFDSRNHSNNGIEAKTSNELSFNNHLKVTNYRERHLDINANFENYNKQFLTNISKLTIFDFINVNYHGCLLEKVFSNAKAQFLEINAGLPPIPKNEWRTVENFTFTFCPCQCEVIRHGDQEIYEYTKADILGEITNTFIGKIHRLNLKNFKNFFQYITAIKTYVPSNIDTIEVCLIKSPVNEIKLIGAELVIFYENTKLLNSGGKFIVSYIN